MRVPRKFIVQEEEIVPIERARKITNESIRHLAQHTNMIAKVEGDDVTPNQILNVFREESFEVYENRFVYTLMQNLIRFIDIRYNVLFKVSDDDNMVAYVPVNCQPPFHAVHSPLEGIGYGRYEKAAGKDFAYETDYSYYHLEGCAARVIREVHELIGRKVPPVPKAGIVYVWNLASTECIHKRNYHQQNYADDKQKQKLLEDSSRQYGIKLLYPPFFVDSSYHAQVEDIGSCRNTTFF